MIMDTELKKIVLTIPFENKVQTELVSEVLNVDKELKGSGITRSINVEENNLVVIFEGCDYKKLRVTLNGFIKSTLLIVKTISLFS